MKYVKECDKERRIQPGYLPLSDTATHAAQSFSETNITAVTQEIRHTLRYSNVLARPQIGPPLEPSLNQIIPV
jgi:hypothetical protein